MDQKVEGTAERFERLHTFALCFRVETLLKAGRHELMARILAV